MRKGKLVFWALIAVLSVGVGVALIGCGDIGAPDATTLPPTTTTTSTTTTTTSTTTTTTTTSTTTSTLFPFQISGTILQNECTFETTWIGLMTWPASGGFNTSSEVTFVSEEASYITGTTEAGTYIVIAMAESYDHMIYIGTVGSNTGEMAVITPTPYTFEAGVPVNLTAPTFEMYTVF